MVEDRNDTKNCCDWNVSRLSLIKGKTKTELQQTNKHVFALQAVRTYLPSATGNTSTVRL